MELTAEQRQVVDHPGGRLRVEGRPGHGRTTALVARYLALVGRGHPPSAVLVVCADRAAATRFRDAVLPHLRGGFDRLPVTTWFGVAFDLVARERGGPVRLVSGQEQRAIVRRLLAGASPSDWPEHGRYLGREAFADEVARALLELEPPVTGELARFAAVYDAHLAERGQTVAARLFAAASGAALARPGGYEHVLVDDHDRAAPRADLLLAGLVGAGTGLTVVMAEGGRLPIPGRAARAVALTRPFRRPGPPTVVTCPHPSTEAEAVAWELLAAHSEGVPWSGMAVLVRRPGLRSRAIARALARHRIPVAPGPGVGTGMDDPAVLAIVDLLRWVTGDEEAAARLTASPLASLGPEGLAALRDDLAADSTGGATPADLAFTVWARGLGHLASGQSRDDASLDAVVGFVDRLERLVDDDPSITVADVLAMVAEGRLEPDRWRAAQAGTDRQAVTVTSIDAAAGREWHTVVVAGCVEGELPRVRGRALLFDPAPLPPAARREVALAVERALFRTACSRATGSLVATAAPEPGVLLSRFVEGWTPAPARPPQRLGPPPVARQETANPVGVFPGGELSLSATKLTTYDDCPLRYAYEYALHVRDDAGARAALGTLVHAVLAELLDPAAPPPTHERLLALAAEHWRDDIARYRPQVEECRRDYFAMLEQWWAVEGEGPLAPEVLAAEHRFDIDVAGVRLSGAIDRVDRAADGEGVFILDYKSGRTEKRADAVPDDLQLAVYHLAASRDPELAALGPPRHLQLLYLRTMHRLEQPITADHAEVTEARIGAAAADIRAERFEPAVDAECRTCPFHRLCPLQPEGREVGAA